MYGEGLLYQSITPREHPNDTKPNHIQVADDLQSYPLSIRGELYDSLKINDPYVHNIGTNQDEVHVVPKLPFIIQRVKPTDLKDTDTSLTKALNIPGGKIIQSTKSPLIKVLNHASGAGVEMIPFLGEESYKLNCLSKSLKYKYEVLYSGKDHGLTTKYIKPDYAHLNLEKYLLWNDNLAQLYYADKPDVAGVEAHQAIENN